MKVNPGKYRYPAELYEVPPQDDFGGSDQEPKKLRRLWIDFMPQRGSETNDNDKMAGINSYELRTPYTPEPLNSSMQLRWNGDVYEITNVMNEGHENKEYVLTAVRREKMNVPRARRGGRFA